VSFVKILTSASTIVIPQGIVDQIEPEGKEYVATMSSKHTSEKALAITIHDGESKWNSSLPTGVLSGQANREMDLPMEGLPPPA
jgi:hypothetical protein